MQTRSDQIKVGPLCKNSGKQNSGSALYQSYSQPGHKPDHKLRGKKVQGPVVQN